MGEQYEIALTEWKLTPKQLNEEWTEELFALMFKARNKRIQHLNQKPGENKQPARLIKDQAAESSMFAALGIQHVM